MRKKVIAILSATTLLISSVCTVYAANYYIILRGRGRMRRYVINIVLLLAVVMISGCNKKNTDSAREFLNSTTKDASESVMEEPTTIKDDLTNKPSGISRAFIEARYPGKIILNYMYAETTEWNEEVVHKYTDEQMVAVNDYLTEKGQGYVINFMPVKLENMTLEYVLDAVNSENPPDIITSVGFNDVVDNSTQKMVFNGVFQNLDEYSETVSYKKLMDAYPTGLYNLSLYNGMFYGFKTSVFENQVIYYLYNKDIADKYGIKESDIEGKSLVEIVPVLDKIKGWNEGNEKSITASYMYMDMVNFINPNIYFDNYDREPVFMLESIGVDTYTENDNVIAITDSCTLKKEYEGLYEIYHKGYSCINGIKDEDHYYSTSNVLGDNYSSFIENVFSNTAGNEIGAVYTRWNQGQNMALAYGTKRYTTDLGGWTIINGVCSSSHNKEKALEALAYICTDEILSNIMVRGVDSTEYEVKNYTPKNEERYPSDGTGCLGNQYLVKTYDDIDRQLAAKSMEVAEIAMGIEGYYFDLSDYKEEVTLIQQIEGEFFGTYEIPRLFSNEYESFEEAWNDFDKKLEEAGIDKILSEINRQRFEIDRGLGK